MKLGCEESETADRWAQRAHLTVVAVLAAIAPAWSLAAEAATTIRVTPGVGIHSGAPLVDALARVAALRRSGNTGPVQIALAAGIYRLAAPLRIELDHTGADGARLLLAGPANGLAILSGSVPIARQQGPVRDSLRALVPAAARDRVVRYALPDDSRPLALVDTPRPPEEVSVVPFEVFDRDGVLPPARWPSEGYAAITRVDGGMRFALEGAAGRADAWRADVDAWVGGFFNQQWKFETRRLATAGGDWIELTPHPPLFEGVRVGGRAYVYHVLAGLDRPGAWVRDRASNELIVWPRGAAADIEVSRAETLVVVEKGRNVALSNLVFERTRGDAIVVRNSENVTIARSTVRQVAGRGIVIERSRSSGLLRTAIEDTGSGGVVLDGGDRASLQSGLNYVRECRIQRFSRLARTYAPAVRLEGVGHEVSESLLADGEHAAILFQGNEHRISSNEITRVMSDSSDGGAIYTGRDWTARGTVIQYNFIHDIRPAPGFEVKGVYLDDMASGIAVTNNVFLRVDQAVFIGGGHENRVEANVFIAAQPAVHIDSRGQNDHRQKVSDPTSEYRRSYAAVPVSSSHWKRRYPGLEQMTRGAAGVASGNRVQGNFLDPDSPFDILDDVDRSRQSLGPNVTLAGDLTAARGARSLPDVLRELGSRLPPERVRNLLLAAPNYERAGAGRP